MAQISTIDPVDRIEGHLRIEMQVEGGKVQDAWVSGSLFRGMELILEQREPTDASMISQRICGVCPISHCHASCFAGEKAYGIDHIPNGARLVRNIIEGSQFLHSHILWFYNLTGLDYVNPLHALKANVADTYDLAASKGLAGTDFKAIKARLKTFADNGQLSIFSGNWFDSEGGDAYKLPAEVDLIATAHYLEALEMQAVASEISGIVGGKMPHIMTSIPGGTAFYPTEEKLDDILFRATRILDWVKTTLIPDTLAIAPFYKDVFEYGKGCGRYIAWGVFDRDTYEDIDRYLPAGIVETDFSVSRPNEDLITESTIRSYYEDDGTPLNPRQGVTKPNYDIEGGYDVNKRYTWSKAPRYDGKPYEAGPLSRMLSAYVQGVPRVKELVDSTLKTLGAPVSALQSTLGRVAARNLECLYVAELEVAWIQELAAALKEGDAQFFAEPVRDTGSGTGMWEAPRGAIYHTETIKNGKIEHYQILIPSTWNISPRDADGVCGPMEQALIGCPVGDIEKPIHALRTVHSFDPCIACAVHITEPSTGKEFKTVTSPWGVK